MQACKGKAPSIVTIGILVFGQFALSLFAGAQRNTTANRLADECGGAKSAMVTVHAAQRGAPYLNLCDGRALAAASAPAGQALALASADFDEDGVPDLVSGFAAGKGGSLTVHRGNVSALWPYGAALRNGTPPSFLPSPRSFQPAGSAGLHRYGRL